MRTCEAMGCAPAKGKSNLAVNSWKMLMLKSKTAGTQKPAAAAVDLKQAI